MSRVIIIGGGAAGILAAVSAAAKGHEVCIYEKNEKLGKKLYITGKGRCNVTNASDMQTVMNNVVRNPKFLYSSFKNLTNEDIMQMIENAGCALKVERGNRVFPVSDHSSDVLKALEKILRDYGVKVFLKSEVTGLWIEEECIKGITVRGNEKVLADAVIVATGGLSYPATGSTGDGHRFAKRAGHRLKECLPSLVPLVIEEPTCGDLQGLSLKNIEVCVLDGGKELYRDFGEMLFTHFGVSGPVILSSSSYVVESLKKHKLLLHIDLKPALSFEQLEQRVLRDFLEFKNKNLKNALVKLFPARLIPEVIRQSGIPTDIQVNAITKKQRQDLIRATKCLEYTIVGTRGFKEAIITKGGVDVSQINPSTMESKLIKGLYFAGEILDLDALTGGYNLQIAWSTGWCAGEDIEYVE